MPVFRVAANDESIDACIEKRKESLRDFLANVHTIVEASREKVARAKESLSAWRATREGMVPMAGSVDDLSDEAEDLEKLLETGLQWEMHKPVVKARRPVPAPKDASEALPVPPPQSLLEELRSVVDDAYQIDEITSNVLSLIDLVTPCPVEGQDPPVVLMSLKAVVASIWTAMVPVKKIAYEYLNVRAHCEEEYYKEYLTCDWREMVESHDYLTYQKVVRSRKLFCQVILYMSDLICKNLKTFDLYLDPKKRALAGRKLAHSYMA